jgi:hypothetical protein
MTYPPAVPWRELAEHEMLGFSASEALAYEMGSLAAEACAEAQAHWHTTLDYSADSVELLEYRLLAPIYNSLFPTTMQRLFGRRSPTPDEVWQLALPWGAYLGEVLRLAHGAVWQASAVYTSELSCSMLFAGGVISPPDKVYRRLTDGPEDNVHEYYRWLVQMEG